MSLDLIIMVGTLFVLAGIGVPIAYAIIAAAMAYMLSTGTSVGIVGKTLVDGIYGSFLLLAVPLF
ncbi:MAG: TRAP transporter large permease, partial [Pseudomonadota bacterium]|nr:TRAP transporter large permease [Pseudomonadota bacterium]